MLSRALPSEVLSNSCEGHSTTSLSNLFQGLIVLMMKKIFSICRGNYPWSNFCLLLLGPSLCMPEKRTFSTTATLSDTGILWLDWLPPSLLRSRLKKLQSSDLSSRGILHSLLSTNLLQKLPYSSILNNIASACMYLESKDKFFQSLQK